MIDRMIYRSYWSIMIDWMIYHDGSDDLSWSIGWSIDPIDLSWSIRWSTMIDWMIYLSYWSIMINRMIYHDWSDDLSIILIYHDLLIILIYHDLLIILIYHDRSDDLPWLIGWYIDPIDLSWSIMINHPTDHDKSIGSIDLPINHGKSWLIMIDHYYLVRC